MALKNSFSEWQQVLGWTTPVADHTQFLPSTSHRSVLAANLDSLKVRCSYIQFKSMVINKGDILAAVMLPGKKALKLCWHRYLLCAVMQGNPEEEKHVTEIQAFVWFGWSALKFELLSCNWKFVLLWGDHHILLY